MISSALNSVPAGPHCVAACQTRSAAIAAAANSAIRLPVGPDDQFSKPALPKNSLLDKRIEAGATHGEHQTSGVGQAASGLGYVVTSDVLTYQPFLSAAP